MRRAQNAPKETMSVVDSLAPARAGVFSAPMRERVLFVHGNGRRCARLRSRCEWRTTGAEIRGVIGVVAKHVWSSFVARHLTSIASWILCAFAQSTQSAMLRIAARHTARVCSALAPSAIGAARAALVSHSSRCLSASTPSTPTGSPASSAASGHAAPARPAPMAPDTSRVHPNTKQASLQFARWLAQVRHKQNERACGFVQRCYCHRIPCAHSCSLLLFLLVCAI